MKEAKHHAELDRLIGACLEGQLTAAEAEKLNTLIEGSGEARRRYWELALVHGMLEQGLQAASVKAAAGEQPAVARARQGFILKWPSLTAAAAGVVLGVFSASLVWAYKDSPPGRVMREEILFESFEGDDARTLVPAFPDRAGEWFGDLTVGVLLKNGLEPERGESVARFIPVSTRKYSYAQYILDLEDLAPSQIEDFSQLEVKASFSSDQTSAPTRYQIRLAAFAQPPEEVRAIWIRESLLFDTVLQHTARNYLASPEREGWKKLASRIDPPSGTRSVVISLGVAEQGGAPPSGDHHLDAVRVRLISGPAPQD
ncbi:MAG: hypothetical protein ABF384_10790 [Verrucomicrobiales bacterium]